MVRWLLMRTRANREYNETIIANTLVSKEVEQGGWFERCERQKELKKSS